MDSNTSLSGLEMLLNRLKSQEPLVGAAIGSGMAAAAAEEGGADFLMVLSAGVFRTIGCGSMAALLPYANANEMTMDAATRSVLPRVKKVPVFVGLCAQDPTMNVKPMLRRIRELGFVGVTNFPSVGFIDGEYRRSLENAGMGLAVEVELLRAANEEGLLTIGFCFNSREAVSMAKAGVDILNVDLGFAEWRTLDPDEHHDQIDESLRFLNDIYAQVEKVRENPYLTVYGGPLVLPQDTAIVYQRTKVRGYIGGSTIERFPAAPLITQTMKTFKRTASRGWREGRLGALIGSCPKMHQLFEMIPLVAESDAPVLVVGESGTGKELVAREIHRLSRRAMRPMVSMNCGSISETLAMSELFGHEKGAFTGATSMHRGKFEQADGTTLFMDEVAELPASAQASLLRVLQEKEVVRVGGDRPVRVDVRVISATNEILARLVKERSFRLDLYYRLSIVVLRIPPLRERRDDIPRLTMELANELARSHYLPVPRIPDAVMQAFLEHTWPGNVRELRNAVERCLILGKGEAFQKAWLDDLFEMASTVVDVPAVETRSHSRQRLAAVLKRHKGNKAAAARELGVTRKTIYQWMREDGLGENGNV